MLSDKLERLACDYSRIYNWGISFWQWTIVEDNYYVTIDSSICGHEYSQNGLSHWEYFPLFMAAWSVPWEIFWILSWIKLLFGFVEFCGCVCQYWVGSKWDLELLELLESFNEFLRRWISVNWMSVLKICLNKGSLPRAEPDEELLAK